MATSVSFDVYAKDRASKTFSNVGSSAHASEGHVHSFGETLKKVGEAFLVFEGAKKVGEFLKGATEAAITDQAAQKSLALALGNTTNANKEQIAGVDEWLAKQSTALGFSKADLQPAFQKLAQSTGSVTKAQKELTLAMNVSAGTGKDLATVSTAINKANLGSTGGLSRLGIATKVATSNTDAIKTAQIAAQTAQIAYNKAVTSYGPASTEAQMASEKLKVAQDKVSTAQATTKYTTLTLNQALHKMSDTFGGQAKARTDTLAGSMSRLKATWHEMEISVGDHLIPVLTTMSNWFLNKGMPAAEAFGSEVEKKVTPKLEALGGWVKEHLPDVESFGRSVGQKLAPAAKALGQELKKDQPYLDHFAGSIKDASPKVAKLAGDIGKLTSKLGGSGIAPPLIHIAGFFVRATQAGDAFAIQGIGKIASALDKLVGPIGASLKAWENWERTLIKGANAIPSRIRSAIGNLGHLLFNAGSDLIQGLIDGIGSKIGAVKDKLTGLTHDLTSWKGPPAKDRILLKPAGVMLMEGLVAGIEQGSVKVQAALSKVTAGVAAANQKLQNAIQARKSYVQGFQGFATSVFGADYGTDVNGNPVKPTASSIIAFQKKQAHQAHVVKHDTRKLIQMGLSPALLKQLQSEGSAGMAEIKALASASPAEIARLNRLNKQTSSDLHSAGMSAGNRIYGEQIKQDRAHYRRDEKLLTEVRDLIKDLRDGGLHYQFEIKGNTLVAILKKEQRTTGNHA